MLYNMLFNTRQAGPTSDCLNVPNVLDRMLYNSVISLAM